MKYVAQMGRKKLSDIEKRTRLVSCRLNKTEAKLFDQVPKVGSTRKIVWLIKFFRDNWTKSKLKT